MKLHVHNTFSNKAIIIFGPTGAGKSELADAYAQNLPIEIVNMDIGSFYTPCSIGTAKPEWKKSTVTHHLFDIIDTPKDVSVIEYRNKVENVIKGVWSRSKLPLLVGGSGFYLKSLFFPPLGNVLYKGVFDEQDDESWDKLYRIDAERAEKIHPRDRYRISRALRLWRITGCKPSEYKPVYNPLVQHCSLLYLTRDRNDLYTRIDRRVDRMMQDGLIEEVYNLYQQDCWREFLERKKIIGYNDFFNLFESAKHDVVALHRAVSQVKSRTRKYAKRQETFWRMLKKELIAATTKHDKVCIQSINASKNNVFDIPKTHALYKYKKKEEYGCI